MESAPRGPSIIATAAELLIFRSAEAAEGYLEPIDVQDGEYVAAWDSTGRPLALTVVAVPGRSWFGRFTSGRDAVSVQLASVEPDEAGLRDRIISDFERRGDAPPPADAPLATYLEALVARNGYIC